MFNLIARRNNEIRVRATLKSHRPSAETSGVLWIRRSKVRILPRQPSLPPVDLRAPRYHIWWLRARRAWRGLQEGATKCAEVHLIRLLDVHLIRPIVMFTRRRVRRAATRGATASTPWWPPSSPPAAPRSCRSGRSSSTSRASTRGRVAHDGDETAQDYRRSPRTGVARVVITRPAILGRVLR